MIWFDSKKWLLKVFGVMLVTISSADALEYRFEVGEHRLFEMRLVDSPVEIECHLRVVCEKVKDVNHGSMSPGQDESTSRKYSLTFEMSDMRIAFQHEAKSSYPYERPLLQVTNFAYDVVMDSMGVLYESSYASAISKVNGGSSNATALVVNDIIRPFTIAIWRNLFPRFGEIKEDRAFFREQDCAKFGLPAFIELRSRSRDGFRIKHNAKMSEDQNGSRPEGCAIWESIRETCAHPSIGDAKLIEENSEIMLFFDTEHHVFSNVYVSDKRSIEGRSRGSYYYMSRLESEKRGDSSQDAVEDKR